MKIIQTLLIVLLVPLALASVKAKPAQTPHVIIAPEDPCDLGDSKKCEDDYAHGVSLEVIGLDGSGSINEETAKSVHFIVHGMKADFSLMQIDLTTKGNNHQGESSWFDYDNASQSFTLSAKGLKELVSAVKKSGTASLDIDMPTHDYEDGYLFIQSLHYQD